MRVSIRRELGHTYLPGLLGDSPIVLDLGANHGEFTKIMIADHGARCVAVEPNRRLHADLASSGATEIIWAAVGPNDGRSVFHVASKDDASSLLSPIGTHSVEEIVPLIPIDQLIDDLHLERIDLLKVDIEGMEIQALLGVRDDQLATVQQCTVEFHDDQGYVSRVDVLRAIRRMKVAGFRTLKMSFTDHSDILFVRAGRCSWAQWARLTLFGIKLHQAQRAFHRLSRSMRKSR